MFITFGCPHSDYKPARSQRTVGGLSSPSGGSRFVSSLSCFLIFAHVHSQIDHHIVTTHTHTQRQPAFLLPKLVVDAFKKRDLGIAFRRTVHASVLPLAWCEQNGYKTFSQVIKQFFEPRVAEYIFRELQHSAEWVVQSIDEESMLANLRMLTYFFVLLWSVPVLAFFSPLPTEA